MTEKEQQAIHRLTPLLLRAGLPEDMHEEFIDGISNFTTMMTVLLAANQADAPNFLTFALITPKGDQYELTVRKSDGKTPSELIDSLKEEIEKICGDVDIARYERDNAEREQVKAQAEIERLREQSTRLSQDGSRMAQLAGTAEGKLEIIGDENKRLRLAIKELESLTMAVGKPHISDLDVDIKSIYSHFNLKDL